MTDSRPSTFSTAHVLMAVVLIVFGSVGRLLLKDLPNIETITVVSLLAGSLLGGVWTFTIGLAVVGITDIFIGNTSILYYTWSAWALTGLFGVVLRKREKRPFRHAAELTGAGFVANVFFYLWTNFGVWHIGGLYPHTLEGLFASYVAGLPFLKYQLISTLIFVPSVSAAAIAAWNRLPTWLSKKTPTAEESTAAYVRD